MESKVKKKATLVIPAAGCGQRFIDGGYIDPKPFIKLPNGLTMLATVLDNLMDLSMIDEIILIGQEDHQEYFETFTTRYRPLLKIKYLQSHTQGTADTVMLGLRSQDEGKPFIVANCDQYVDPGSVDIFYRTLRRLRFANQDDPASDEYSAATAVVDVAGVTDVNLDAYSYIMEDEISPKVNYMNVMLNKEKAHISDWANVGLFYFHSLFEFKLAYQQMVNKKDFHNGETYLSNILNHMKSLAINVGPMENSFYPLGTPELFKQNQEIVL